MPRLNLTTEQFRLTQAGSQAMGKTYAVADLSSTGMAIRLLDSADLAVFPVGMKLSGLLNLKGEKREIHARVRHIGPDLVGCEFEGLDAAAQGALRTYLDPQVVGAELKLIPAADGDTLWYNGPSGADLIFWGAPEVTKFALFLMGNYVQWEQGRGVSTGRVNSSYEQSEVRGVMRFETILLEADSKPVADKLSVAKTVILSSNLSEELKKSALERLKG